MKKKDDKILQDELAKLLAEYLEDGFIDVTRIMREFIALSKVAMKTRQDYVTVQTSLAAVLACYLDTQVLPALKEK